MLLFVFFNDTPSTEIYTLSLHDALPIWRPEHRTRFLDAFFRRVVRICLLGAGVGGIGRVRGHIAPDVTARSEEHTSELQSLRHLVCRLLLEKKKKKKKQTCIAHTNTTAT